MVHSENVWQAASQQCNARPKWLQTMPCMGSMCPLDTGLAETTCKSHGIEPSAPLIQYFQKVLPCTNYTKTVWLYLFRASSLVFHMPLRRHDVISGLGYRAGWRGDVEVMASSCFCSQCFSGYCHLVCPVRHRPGSCRHMLAWESGKANRSFSCNEREILETMQAWGCSTPASAGANAAPKFPQSKDGFALQPLESQLTSNLIQLDKHVLSVYCVPAAPQLLGDT